MASAIANADLASATLNALAPPKTESDIQSLSINTIRTLSMDAVQKANSGHPGTPMAMAPVAYCLWQKFLRFDPQDPIWPNRDRFVLSMGHASMLLYSMLHLTGVKAVSKDYERLGDPSVTLDSIKHFRQLHSKCAGHPEYRWTSGIETTTGPLGQGYATSVGMAMGGKWLAATYNKPDMELFNFNVYALGGDGCMEEGVSHEAASLAGHLKLDNLCWIYDNNHISIEGNTNVSYSDDVATRFMGYNWAVTRVADANDIDMLSRAFEAFLNTKGRPTLIIVDSHIGYGSKKQDSHTAHGEPLGKEVIAEFKKRFNLSPEDFHVPPEVYKDFQNGMGKRGKELRDKWFAMIGQFAAKSPKEADQLKRMQHRQLPEGWDKDIPTFKTEDLNKFFSGEKGADGKKVAPGMAGRIASGQVLNAIAKNVPWLIGGAADLEPSTKTGLKFPGAGDFEAGTYAGRNLHFGIRELGMGACLNGLALIKIRPYGSGFFIFSDFSRPPIRLAAIMEIPVIYIFTHDSIGVGEDGPTHQPIEQLSSLRAIPGLLVLRPCDANEVAEAWRYIMQLHHEPAILVLTRQELPTLDRSKYAPASNLAKGAYVVADADGGKPDVLLLATGSEVHLCLMAYEKLKAEGVKARVVSMPSWELFEHQDKSYKDSVLPPAVTARVSVEQASTFGWSRYIGLTGKAIGMETFGASAPLKDLQREFGFTLENVIKAAKDQVQLAKK
jgi:transketolase